MQETSSQEETQIEIVKSVNSFFIHFSKASKEIYHEELFTEKGNVSRHRSMFQIKLTIYIWFVCNFSYLYIIFIYLKYLFFAIGNYNLELWYNFYFLMNQCKYFCPVLIYVTDVFKETIKMILIIINTLRKRMSERTLTRLPCV